MNARLLEDLTRRILMAAVDRMDVLHRNVLVSVNVNASNSADVARLVTPKGDATMATSEALMARLIFLTREIEAHEDAHMDEAPMGGGASSGAPLVALGAAILLLYAVL